MTIHARRIDDQLVPQHGDGSGPAMTVREMLLEHDRDISDLKAWRVQTKVYEALLRWVLVVAVGALLASVVNLLVTAASAGVVR